MAHQSLYRRYRPRNFSEIKGQEHVVTALRNAVAGDSAAHAYMFSGPRGTGKTSTARIFAKALNCTSLRDGEPCCECESCLAMQAGNSFDLFELDAASNNGVDAIRDLVERTMVTSPGRTKVYILDEVHMLSAAASNALLKTLEEPPEHVRFVLATTDPQKVLPTIRSRTQHFEFTLLSAGELTDHARWVAQDAGLELDDESIAHAVRRGRGSVRDMLSALDQVAAAGGVVERSEPVDELFSALADRAEGVALVTVADAIAQGHDPRVLAEAFVAEIREAFLLSIGVDTPHLVDSDRARLGLWAEKVGSAGLSRAMERIGSALVDMRSAADPRVPLEVALIQLTASTPETTATPAGSPGDAAGSQGDPAGGAGSAAVTVELAELRQRVEQLEAALSALGAEPSTPLVVQDTPERAAGAGKADDARAALGRSGRAKPPPPPPRRSRSSGPTASRTPPAQGPSAARAPDPAPTQEPAQPAGESPAVGATGGTPAVEATAVDPDAPPGAPGQAAEVGATQPSAASPGGSPGSMPERDALVMAFGDRVTPRLKGIAKAIYSQGRFVSVSDTQAVFAVENAPTRERAERYRPEVEALLGSEFGVPVPLKLIVEGDEGAAGAAQKGPTSSRSTPRAPGAPADPDTSSEAGPHGSREGASAAPVGTQRPDVPESDVPEGDASEEEAEIMAQVPELEDADVQTSTVDRLTAAFPGAELIESEEAT